MGAIADAIVAYAQPLLDQTDGSLDQMNTAFALAQLCWNLAILPEGGRDEALHEMRPAMKMDDDEFEAFRRTVLVPMIQRHHEMFPHLHRPSSMGPSRGPGPMQTSLIPPPRADKHPGTARNAACPCNSGRKYKLCCGR